MVSTRRRGRLSSGRALGYARRWRDRSRMTKGGARWSKISVAPHRRGLAPAIYLLGVMTERGVGTERDPGRGRAPAAAAKGNRSGQASWGRALMWDLIDQTRQKASRGCAGRRWLVIRTRQRAATSMPMPGRCRPTTQRQPSGSAVRQRAGHHTAARALGLLYLTGAGVARDPREAANWLRISADAGDPQAGGSRQSPPARCQ